LRKPSFPIEAERNYYGILPFKCESSRNATIGSIFQAPAWVRGLIQPHPGRGLIYADYVQEEFYLAAVLSGDPVMQALYEHGDPYVSLAAMVGLMPGNGTKKEYPRERNLAKTATLAIQYGIKARSLAVRLGVSLHRAEDLITAHHRSYRKYWIWANKSIAAARWTGNIETIYGWKLAVDSKTKDNTLLNFPVQGCGAEILRIASILLWEAGIRVVAPVHDAFLVECAESDLKDVAEEVRRLMAQSGEYVLSSYLPGAAAGSRLRTEARILRHPDRLLESRGLVMWDQIQAIENRLRRAA
jgi:DNA polymerase I-like protein with 3'-5' exonuclease and polymerase domains